MVVFKFFVLTFVVFCESKINLLPQAIFQLIQSHYGESSVKIEVFYNSDRIEIIDETLKLLSAVKNLKVTKIDTANINVTAIEHGDHYDNFSKDAIFLFDTTENYLKFAKSIVDGHAEQKFQFLNFLVYCEDLSRLLLETFVSDETFESFLLKNDDSKITLNAITMFTKQLCSTPQLIEINQFSDSKRKWKTANFLSPIIENFHGCKVRISVSDHAIENQKLLFCQKTDLPDGTLAVEGVFVEMVEALSSLLNFEAVYPKYFDENFHSDLSFVLLKFGEAILMGDFSISEPFCSTSDVFLVPPGDL